MTINRPAPSPPRITGYEYQQLLGRGGYADVFLFQENATSRSVAVKVLNESALSSSVNRQFESELRLMGQLSNHPSIVTLFNQGIANDGRPYLVMEFCPGANLGQRFRKERVSVTEVLAVGVSVAGAVETAHMADILHLDIKPANILVTEFDNPVLADFGIAKLRSAGSGEVAGVSVPWAPPEIFSDKVRSDKASDVWGMSALLYSLLAGRSPFEIVGGDNSEAALIDRICNSPLAPTGRTDVPPSLERVLAAGMSKTPTARVGTAAMLARMLQGEQVRMGLAETKLIVRAPASTHAPVAATNPTDGTRFAVRSVRPTRSAPTSESPSGSARPRFDPAPLPAAAPEASELTTTRHRDVVVSPPDPAPESRRFGPRSIAATVALLAAAGVVAFLALGAPDSTSAPDSIREMVPTQRPGAGGDSDAPAVIGLTGRPVTDGIEFTWRNPAAESGDSYRWIPTQTGRIETVSETSEPIVILPPNPGRTCIKVSLVRESGRSSSATEVCYP